MNAWRPRRRAPGLAVVRHLGRGHALQPDMDAVDHDGVTVEHVGAAGQALAGGRGKGRGWDSRRDQRLTAFCAGGWASSC